MTIDRSEWGVRLSDRVRAALAAGDIEVARGLVAEGDGMAKSLEKEYSLMLKGLGITIRILLDLVEEAAARRATDEARRALSGILRGFCGDVARLASCVEADESPDLAGAFARTRRLLAEAEARFDREHGELARRILEALDRRDGAAALELVDRKELTEFVPLHDRLVRFMAEVWAWVLERFGAEELGRFHLAAAEAQRRGFEAWERLPAEGFARATAFLVRQHMGDTTILEDEERFQFVLSPCGSGGRLRRGGAYEGSGALPYVEEPGALTFGKSKLPVYCSHCPMWNSVAASAWFGHPQWVFDDPARADGSCRMSIYKRPENIPAEYLRRLGIHDRA
jgi:hypothetical protein